MKHKLLPALAFVALSGSAVSADQDMFQEQAITVTGCIEKDAAASTAIYKIIVSQPDGSSVIYQLNAPGSSAVPAAVGKTAQVTGAVSIEKRAGREIKVITVKTFEVVAEGCRLRPDRLTGPADRDARACLLRRRRLHAEAIRELLDDAI